MITKNKTRYEVETNAKCLTDKAVDEAGAVAYQTFKKEDVEISNDYQIPFHAICDVKVETSNEEIEVNDDTCISGDEPTPPGPDAPTITGAGDISISEGDTFDPMDGVSATDSEGNPVDVTVEGEVDLNTPGVYTLTYTATDSEGRTTTITRKVTVVEKNAPIINGATNISVAQGVGIDLTDGVSATLDGEGIEFSVDPKTIDKCEVGEHDVTYTATGNGKTTTVVRKVTITAIDDPTISGLTDLTVEVGEEFDPLEGVTAKDGNGNDVEVEIVSDADEWVLIDDGTGVDVSLEDLWWANAILQEGDVYKLILLGLIDEKSGTRIEDFEGIETAIMIDDKPCVNYTITSDISLQLYNDSFHTDTIFVRLTGTNLLVTEARLYKKI